MLTSAMEPSTDDWPALVAARGREEFVAAFRHPFLLALSGLDAPPPPARTVRMEGGAQLMAALMAERRRMAAGEKFPAVLPVRKVQTTFPSMITVGRARNNDIVVPDALVSKFHAFFRQVDADWALSDAGSANGTKVGDVALVPKGAAEKVRSGEKITFGVSSFRFVDAAGLWAALHEPDKPV
ncbi:MAG: domain containing protein [Myxococcales bacterium]|nr:domain containing protein [Myxococcales bacterium]